MSKSFFQAKVFEDEDGIRREEIAALRGQDMYRYSLTLGVWAGCLI